METKTATDVKATAGNYSLTGTLLEACSCNILCPCWVGEDPDGGVCNGMLAYHIDEGHIRGIDVSGRTMVGAAHFPGNVMAGGAQLLMIVDDGATDEQAAAIIDCFQGKLGGPLEELMGVLIGETGAFIGVERLPVAYNLVEGEGTVTVGSNMKVTAAPYRSMYGTVTTLRDSVMSTIPGSPAWVGKSSELKVDFPQYQMTYELSGRNAIQGEFHLEG